MSTNINQLPVGFPETLSVKLQEGSHNGRSQLWAPFMHEGKVYRLIITNKNWRCMPQVGEEWEMFPERSPNGHVVFCHATQQLTSASGDHPIVARTRTYVERGTSMSIRQEYPRGGAEKLGIVKEVKVDGGVLSITLQGEGSPFTFTCQVRNTQGWGELLYRHYGFNSYGGCCHENGKEYRITFWGYVRDY